MRAIKIVDKFVIEGRGIALTGKPYPEAVWKKILPGTELEVRSGDEVILRTELTDFDQFRNCWSQHKPNDLAILIVAPDFELPADADVWAEEPGL